MSDLSCHVHIMLLLLLLLLLFFLFCFLLFFLIHNMDLVYMDVCIRGPISYTLVNVNPFENAFCDSAVCDTYTISIKTNEGVHGCQTSTVVFQNPYSDNMQGVRHIAIMNIIK